MSEIIFRKYGVATFIRFPLVTAGGTDYLIGAVDGGTDCFLDLDNSGPYNTANDFQESGNGIYYLRLAADEMAYASIVVTIIDQSETKAYEDQAIIIETYGDASAQHNFVADITDGLTLVNDSLTTGLTNTLTHKEDAALTNLSTEPTIDVDRDDTGASVAGYPTTMTAVSTGVYNDTFTPPSTSTTYTVTISYVQTNGATRTITGRVVSVSAVTLNAFITLAEFYQHFDANLIARLSDDTGAGTANTDAISAAINAGADLIYQYLRGHYKSLTTTDFSSITDPWVKKLNATLAMYNLYSRRTSIPDHIAEMKAGADYELEQIQLGRRTLTNGRTQETIALTYPPSGDINESITETYLDGQAGTNQQLKMP